jgi:hypothetical protein
MKILTQGIPQLSREPFQEKMCEEDGRLMHSRTQGGQQL